ncbi:MAG TPA: YdjY domain-containing protein [Planctomycetota bacterium]|nr:YdjY domain-containing protein [Planctomycetota bacterium]
MSRNSCLAFLALVPCLAAQGEPRPAGSTPPSGDAAESMDRRWAEAGVVVDRRQRIVAVRGRFNSPKQPLEYLVTAPHGSHYESLVAIAAKPSEIAAALISLGVDTGTPPKRVRKPAPAASAPARKGAGGMDDIPFEVVPGAGGGVYLYVEWNDDHGFHRHRIEDLVFERIEGRTIPHARFVFANSELLSLRPRNDATAYAADLDGNFASCGFGGSPVLAYPTPHPYAMESDLEIYQPNWTLVPNDELPLTLLFACEDMESPLVPSMKPPPASAPASRTASPR